jgi:predicted phosphohydrolase
MIIIAGDLHGHFWSINGLINKEPRITMILQCGDMGWYPRCTYSYEKRRKFENGDVKIYFCDGNHDDLEVLMKYDKPTELVPNVTYMPRGSVLQLPDKRKVLFIGGAFSVDRNSPMRGHRNPNYGWFEEEVITQRDIYNLPDEKIDIVISHTAPESFKNIKTYGNFPDPNDPSRKALDSVLEKYKPELWYFGHFHNFSQGNCNGCHWTCLSGIAVNLLPGDWWIRLPEI